MSRYYNHENLKYPSVTTIIGDCIDKSGALNQWAANMAVEYIQETCGQTHIKSYLSDVEEPCYLVSGEELDAAKKYFKTASEEALSIGTAVHEAIEKSLLGHDIPELGGEAARAFSAFNSFTKENDVKVFAAEKVVYGSSWAGTLDFYGAINGKKYVVDWKTSKAFYMDSMGPQLAAYKSQMPKAECAGILRLDKGTGEYKFKDVTKRYDKDLKIFNNMVELYFSRHPRIAKNAGWEG